MHNVEIPVKLWSHGEKSNKVSPQWQPQNKLPVNVCLNEVILFYFFHISGCDLAQVVCCVMYGLV